MLRVRLIGGLALELDGRELELPRSRRGRALLAWLALHPVSTPAAALPRGFGQTCSMRVRGRVSVPALTELRRALGPGAGCLITTRETVGLVGDDGGLWVDVRAFDALLDAGRPADAVEIGVGEVLTGMDDEWVLEARSEHNRRLAEALEALAAAAEREGDLAAAVRHSRSAAALDPLDEEAGRRLIARLARAGENASAVAAYESLAGRLRSGLAVAPSPATRALVEEIRRAAHAGPSAARCHSRRYSSASTTARSSAAKATSSGYGPRGRVCRSMARGASCSWQASPVSAKRGSRSSSLVEAGARGALVLIGRCWNETLGSYDPVLTALRQVEDALGTGSARVACRTHRRRPRPDPRWQRRRRAGGRSGRAPPAVRCRRCCDQRARDAAAAAARAR